MSLPDSPAARHASVAAGFSRIAEGTTDWSAPTPVDGWTAMDVVDHLVTWFGGFLASGGIDLPAGPPVADDPVAAWHHHASGVQALLDERGDETFTHPLAGTSPLAEAVDRFYTADVFMHSWDLARAGGLQPDLDEGFAAQMLQGMRPVEAMLRDSGQYGPAVPVPDDAPAVEQLMGFVGRDPGWQPSARSTA
ncbi:maleylpyruvate isomerase family mycothiol-dependent enzyme [Nocardioides lacusdianchii]|uniref:maleylpyruvate isomerase family mycothiol-dependent enzyme n=1 Tax=Nocardioides lacusdianchii TaxID=2783664 RepID=UPI001CCDE178|nr:maleylpyruvate isomerase family mycothiol-dependent enzyme [Nocardioides lacusdianchii]